MAKCERCGRGPQFGKNRPFSLKATNRRFNVNVQKVTLYEDGRRRAMKLCTRCLRTINKTVAP
jgi:large subunit ribosomal protein L28